MKNRITFSIWEKIGRFINDSAFNGFFATKKPTTYRFAPTCSNLASWSNILIANRPKNDSGQVGASWSKPFGCGASKRGFHREIGKKRRFEAENAGLHLQFRAENPILG